MNCEVICKEVIFKACVDQRTKWSSLESVCRVGLGEEDAREGRQPAGQLRGVAGRGHVRCHCFWAKRGASHGLWDQQAMGDLDKVFLGMKQPPVCQA